MSRALGISEALEDPDGLKVFTHQLNPSLSQGAKFLPLGQVSGIDVLECTIAQPLGNSCANDELLLTKEQKGQMELDLERKKITKMGLQDTWRYIFKRHSPERRR